MSNKKESPLFYLSLMAGIALLGMGIWAFQMYNNIPDAIKQSNNHLILVAAGLIILSISIFVFVGIPGLKLVRGSMPRISLVVIFLT